MANTGDNQPHLTGLQSVVLGLLYWPVVAAVFIGSLVLLFDISSFLALLALVVTKSAWRSVYRAWTWLRQNKFAAGLAAGALLVVALPLYLVLIILLIVQLGDEPDDGTPRHESAGGVSESAPDEAADTRRRNHWGKQWEEPGSRRRSDYGERLPSRKQPTFGTQHGSDGYTPNDRRSRMMNSQDEWGQDAIDNRANQLNPNNDAYWQSRGHSERPSDWESRDR
jgi:hypothetical protein